jgi:hypothetical protein
MSVVTARPLRGRGAWNPTGVGGTLTRRGGQVVPGAFYLAAEGDQRINVKVFRQLRAGVVPDRNDYAVFLGAKAIQGLLGVGADGIIGPRTDAAIRARQRALGVAPDGLIGRATMRALCLPVVAAVATARHLRWQVLCGILSYEGGWDPGAVGVTTPDDVGLAQLNLPSHRLSIEAALDPPIAIDYAATFLAANLAALGGNERDAVASYNLGVAGARMWIKAGRPAVWTPPWASTPRNVAAYIDRILTTC